MIDKQDDRGPDKGPMGSIDSRCISRSFWPYPMDSSPHGLRDVAERAGVSLVTASRALSGHPRVRASTRDKVLKAAEALHYRRNPLLSAVAARRFHPRNDLRIPLAVLTCSKRGIHSRHYDLATIRCESLGYQLEIVNVADRGSLRARLKEFNARGLDGVILGQWDSSHHLLRQLDNVNVSVVEAGRHPESTGFHSVSASVFDAVMRAAVEVAERGYRRPVYLLFEHTPSNLDDVVRHAAAVESFRQCEFETSPMPYVVHDWKALQTESFRRWFRGQRPDVMIGFSGNMKHLIWEQRIAGVRGIPFVNLHTSPEASSSSPGITVAEPEVLAAAVDYVHELIKRGERGRPAKAFHRVLESSWHEGRGAWAKLRDRKANPIHFYGSNSS